jgi:hypothetical protein
MKPRRRKMLMRIIFLLVSLSCWGRIPLWKKPLASWRSFTKPLRGCSLVSREGMGVFSMAEISPPILCGARLHEGVSGTGVFS